MKFIPYDSSIYSSVPVRIKGRKIGVVSNENGEGNGKPSVGFGHVFSVKKIIVLKNNASFVIRPRCVVFLICLDRLLLHLKENWRSFSVVLLEEVRNAFLGISVRRRTVRLVLVWKQWCTTVPVHDLGFFSTPYARAVDLLPMNL